ncbi:MAG: hypothetical protein AB7E95_11555, partial [Kiritimatiellales bacterium]
DRNPIWFCTAKEIDSPEGKRLEFSQPEILLYNDDITRRFSYPDLMEMEDGSLLFTETEKETARMHRVPAEVIERVFHPSPPPAEDRLAEDEKLPISYDREGGWEMISGKDTRNGFAVELVLPAGTEPGILLDNRNGADRGFAVLINKKNQMEIVLNDGRSESRWHSTEPLNLSQENHAVLVIDGGPKTITMIVNGRFDDGGETRQFGFGLFHRFFQSANGGKVRPASGVKQYAVYRRALFTSEAVELYKKEMK